MKIYFLGGEYQIYFISFAKNISIFTRVADFFTALDKIYLVFTPKK